MRQPSEHSPATKGSALGRARTCVGCRQPDAPTQMVRWILGPDGQLIADLAGRGFGRGAWVHLQPGCIRDAVKAGFSRSFRQPIAVDVTTLSENLDAAAQARIEGLLMAARRAGHLVAGSEATQALAERGRIALLIVATDAPHATKRYWVRDLVASGRAVAWGDRTRLGAVARRGDTILLAVTDQGLADAILRAMRSSEASKLARDHSGKEQAGREARGAINASEVR